MSTAARASCGTLAELVVDPMRANNETTISWPAQQTRRFLCDGAWFGSLPAALQDAILAGSVQREYRRHDVILREDAPARGLLVLLQGSVHFVGRVAADGDGLGLGVVDGGLLHVGEPGYWFGEYSALTGRPTLMSAVAHTAARVLVLPKASFDRIVIEQPQSYREFARLALDRYGWMLRACLELSELAPEQRLRRRLLRMAQLRLSDRPSDGAKPTLGVSQAELARMLGLSRQTLNTLLRRLDNDGAIEVGFRQVRIVDVERLAGAPAGCGCARRIDAGDGDAQRVDGAVHTA